MAQKKTATNAAPPKTKAPKKDALLAIDPDHAAEALALPAASILTPRLNLPLARHNARIGSEAVLAKRKEIEARVKKPDFEAVERLEALVDSCEAATREAHLARPDQPSREADFARLWPLRELLLSYAETLVVAALVPAEEVAAIKLGKGARDAADDLVELANLYTKHRNRLQGKMGPITGANLTEAKELGTRLKASITPVVAKKLTPAEAKKDAGNLRDRLFTLLMRDWEKTWVLGAMAYGSNVNEFVPGLGSGRKEKA